MSVAAAGDETAGDRGLDSLFEKHGERVRVLLQALSGDGHAVGEGTPYDEIWALRFVLSHPEDAEAARNAAETLRWRAENKDMLAAAARGERLKRFESIEPLVVAQYHGETSTGAPLYIIRAGISNTMALTNTHTHEQMVEFMMYRKELGFLLCDAITRKTNKLTKLVTVNDLSHVSLLAGTDKRFTAVLGAASKLSETLYPQLLDRAVLINAPYIFGAIWSIIKGLMSAKTRAKVAVCGSSDTRKGDISKCPFAKLINLETVPSFLGGGCRCAGGCVRGVSNEQTVMVGMSNPEDGLTPATIAARDKLKVYVDVEAGDKVACYVRVEQRGVEVAAALRPASGGKQAETTLLQKFKHKSDLGAWEKVIDIPQKGTLVLVLNNEYSMLNSKSVKYRVAVLEASDAERLSTMDDDRV
jgi:hypothetical protein